jgi:hypothetical protein
LSGHPDSSSVRGRQQHDHFCTASLNRFDYVDYADRFNLTLWNASVIAGPLRGGTELEIYGRFGFVDFLTLAPEFAGLPDGGQPRCVFGHGLGRKGGAPPDLALTSPATLFGATPLQYHLLTELGDNTSVRASLGRQRMCLGRVLPTVPDSGDNRNYCGCQFAVYPPSTSNQPPPPPIIPACGCGCRRLLRQDGAPGTAHQELDMCVDRRLNRFDPNTPFPDIKCGPHPTKYHRRIDAQPATMARCRAPQAVQSGLYELEYAPGGDVRATSRSTDQAVTYTYYDATFGSVTPRATPLQGGTRFLVRGNNLGQFGVGVQTGALNIYGQPSQVRAYFGYPRCFIGGHHRAVGATLEDCDPLVSGWTQAIGGTSGCQVLRCLAALPMAAVTLALPLLVSLNGQFDSAIFLVNVTYFDQDAVYISTVAPRAAPVTNDVPLRVHGAGFMDLGDMKCVLSTSWGANTPLAGMPRTIYVDANISADARTLICSPDETTRRSALTVNVGITLNGELATLKVAENLPIYFVDLGSIRLSTINPPAGPIRGGTTIVLMASSFTALQACAGTVCPEPPLCLIELRTPGSRPNGSALAYGAAAPARNVTVVGAVRARQGRWALHCDMPSSGLTTQDATELPLAPMALLARIHVALLGYVSTRSTVLIDRLNFTYYDASVSRVHPRGGPPGGGTELTVNGRALQGVYRGTPLIAEGGRRQLLAAAECIFLASPPPPYGMPVQANLPLRSAASAAPGGALRCATPALPAQEIAISPTGVVRYFLEVSLNGYADERTSSTVRLPPSFTYVDAVVSRVHPFGGPVMGGTMLTLRGRNLGDYGGLSCHFVFATLPSVGTTAAADVISSATVVESGDGAGGRTVRCASPSLGAAQLAVLTGSSRGGGGGLPASIELQLTLNGELSHSQLVSAPACNAAAATGDALFADVARATNASDAANATLRARCWAYFDPGAVRLTALQPRGGPHVGGTRLTVHGSGFHDFGGLGCLFGNVDVADWEGADDGGGDGGEESSSSGGSGGGGGGGDGGGGGGSGGSSSEGGAVSRGDPSARYGATLTLFSSATRTDAAEVVCITPPNGALPYTGRVAVRLTLNGAIRDAHLPMNATVLMNEDALANVSNALVFTYYNSAAVLALTAMPSRGGALGSTLLTVVGRGFVDYGGLRCRFGPIGMLPTTSATMRVDGTIACRSPPYAVAHAREQLGTDWQPAPQADAPSVSSLTLPQGSLILGPISGASSLELPALPATLPVSVILNNQSDAGGGEASAGGAKFEFGAEPCEGQRLLIFASGVVDDGLAGASGSYGGAPRNCSWLLRPANVPPGAGYALALFLTAVDVRAGYDSVLIVDGDGDGGTGNVLLALPEILPEISPEMSMHTSANASANASANVHINASANVSASVQTNSSANANASVHTNASANASASVHTNASATTNQSEAAEAAATAAGLACSGAHGGACLQSVLAPSGVAFIQLISRPRADGTSSRLTLTYVLVGPPSTPDHPASVRLQVEQYAADDPSLLAHEPLAVRRARAWSVPATDVDAASHDDGSASGEGGADGAARQWPGQPWEWARSRSAARVAPRSRTFAQGRAGGGEGASRPEAGAIRRAP